MSKSSRICFEINGLAKDENDNPCPCGMQFSFGEDDRETSYAAQTEGVNIPALLEALGLGKAVKPDDVKIITPQEYDEKYGEEADHAQ